MDLRTLSPRTLALLDVASGDALLPFVREAFSDGLEVDLQIVRAGMAHDIAVLAVEGERIVREATWAAPRTSELPQHIAAAVLHTYVCGLQERVARFRVRWSV